MAMADFGPASVTTKNIVAPVDFNFGSQQLFLGQIDCNNDIGDNDLSRETGKSNLLHRTNSDYSETCQGNHSNEYSTTDEGKTLDDSKDSDEGFSSSFSPTSESQMPQGHTASSTTVFWGNKEEFFEPGFSMSSNIDPFIPNANSLTSGSGSYTTSNQKRGSPSPNTAYSSHQRRPTPALSSFLASNKAMANALGVSGWQVNSVPTPVSSWSNHVGGNQMNTNWSQQQRPNLSYPMVNPQHRHVLRSSPFPVTTAHQGQGKNTKTRFSLLSSPRNHTTAITHKNGCFPQYNGNGKTNNSVIHQQGQLGLDSTVVDGISQLTNNFSNLTTSTDVNGSTTNNSLFPSTEKQDVFKYSSLETRLLDIMRSPLDPPDHSQAFRYQVHKKGREDQIVPSLSSSLNDSPRSDLDFSTERFSRKVFVGGLPPDIDEDEIHASFCRFGNLTVDWPHKAESKSYFPPKGYAFLLYKEEMSVQRLIDSCMMQDQKLYLCVSSPTIKDKPVQIRPWSLADADFVMDGSQPLDPRKTIFVGGVPRPLRAVELAMIMDRLYGAVCYAGIDVDPELKYPKGAGRVAFSNQQSYIAAISARFIQLQHGDIDKRVEVKPYVLDDQMCDECHGARCNGKFAPFFCSNITCLQYYCEQCWAIIHARPGREYHKPLVKEGGDRPRQSPLSFRW